MYKAADKLESVGSVASDSSIPVFSTIGEVIQLEAEGLKTIADFNTLETKDAFYNTSVRTLNVLVNKSIENHLAKEKIILDNFMHKTIVNKSTNSIKDQIIIEPK